MPQLSNLEKGFRKKLVILFKNLLYIQRNVSISDIVEQISRSQEKKKERKLSIPDVLSMFLPRYYPTPIYCILNYVFLVSH
jgi:hypothetical protein